MFQEKYSWSWGRLAVILATAGLICIIFPFSSPYVDCPWWESYLIYLFYTFSLWEGCLYILLKIREIYPKIEQTSTRLSLMYTIVMIYVTVMVTILTFIIAHVKSQGFHLEDYWFSLKISLVITLLVFSIYEAVYFFGKWKDAAVETEKLKQENTAAQLEGLKNQVNPHFLFNSLNTLATIILENPPLAVDFVQKLAEVYRYVLNVKDKQTVTLHTELECVEAFIFLLKIRYEHHFNVEITIPEELKSKHLPPVSLQMLVENVIKHNIISTDNPLTMNIYTEENSWLIVENVFQPKVYSGESTGIGLNNIRSRYGYLTDKEVTIEQKDGFFRVKLPLLEI